MPEEVPNPIQHVPIHEAENINLNIKPVDEHHKLDILGAETETGNMSNEIPYHNVDCLPVPQELDEGTKQKGSDEIHEKVPSSVSDEQIYVSKNISNKGEYNSENHEKTSEAVPEGMISERKGIKSATSNCDDSLEITASSTSSTEGNTQKKEAALEKADIGRSLSVSAEKYVHETSEEKNCFENNDSKDEQTHEAVQETNLGVEETESMKLGGQYGFESENPFHPSREKYMSKENPISVLEEQIHENNSKVDAEVDVPKEESQSKSSKISETEKEDQSNEKISETVGMENEKSEDDYDVHKFCGILSTSEAYGKGSILKEAFPADAKEHNNGEDSGRMESPITEKEANDTVKPSIPNEEVEDIVFISEREPRDQSNGFNKAKEGSLEINEYKEKMPNDAAAHESVLDDQSNENTETSQTVHVGTPNEKAEDIDFTSVVQSFKLIGAAEVVKANMSENDVNQSKSQEPTEINENANIVDLCKGRVQVKMESEENPDNAIDDLPSTGRLAGETSSRSQHEDQRDSKKESDDSTVKEIQNQQVKCSDLTTVKQNPKTTNDTELAKSETSEDDESYEPTRVYEENLNTVEQNNRNDTVNVKNKEIPDKKTDDCIGSHAVVKETIEVMKRHEPQLNSSCGEQVTETDTTDDNIDIDILRGENEPEKLEHATGLKSGDQSHDIFSAEVSTIEISRNNYGKNKPDGAPSASNVSTEENSGAFAKDAQMVTHEAIETTQCMENTGSEEEKTTYGETHGSSMETNGMEKEELKKGSILDSQMNRESNNEEKKEEGAEPIRETFDKSLQNLSTVLSQGPETADEVKQFDYDLNFRKTVTTEPTNTEISEVDEDQAEKIDSFSPYGTSIENKQKDVPAIVAEEHIYEAVEGYDEVKCASSESESKEESASITRLKPDVLEDKKPREEIEKSIGFAATETSKVASVQCNSTDAVSGGTTDDSNKTPDEELKNTDLNFGKAVTTELTNTEISEDDEDQAEKVDSFFPNEASTENIQKDVPAVVSEKHIYEAVEGYDDVKCGTLESESQEESASITRLQQDVLEDKKTREENEKNIGFAATEASKGERVQCISTAAVSVGTTDDSNETPDEEVKDSDLNIIKAVTMEPINTEITEEDEDEAEKVDSFSPNEASIENKQKDVPAIVSEEQIYEAVEGYEVKCASSESESKEESAPITRLLPDVLEDKKSREENEKRIGFAATETSKVARVQCISTDAISVGTTDDSNETPDEEVKDSDQNYGKVVTTEPTNTEISDNDEDQAEKLHRFSTNEASVENKQKDVPAIVAEKHIYEAVEGYDEVKYASLESERKEESSSITKLLPNVLEDRKPREENEKNIGSAATETSKVARVQCNSTDAISVGTTDVTETPDEETEENLESVSTDGEAPYKRVCASPIAEDSAEENTTGEVGDKQGNKACHYLAEEHIDEIITEKEKSTEFAAIEIQKAHRIEQNFAEMVSVVITDDSDEIPNEEVKDSAAKPSEQSFKLSDSTKNTETVKSKGGVDQNKDVDASPIALDSAEETISEEGGDKQENRASHYFPKEHTGEKGIAISIENAAADMIKAQRSETNVTDIVADITDNSNGIPNEKVGETVAEASEQSLAKNIEPVKSKDEVGKNKNVEASVIAHDSAEETISEEAGDQTGIVIENSIEHVAMEIREVERIKNNFADTVATITDDSNAIQTEKVKESTIDASEQILDLAENTEIVSKDGNDPNKNVDDSRIAKDSAEQNTSEEEGDKHSNEASNNLSEEHINEIINAEDKNIEFAAVEMNKAEKIGWNFSDTVSEDIFDGSNEILNEEVKAMDTEISTQSFKLLGSAENIDTVKSKHVIDTNKNLDASPTVEDSAEESTTEEAGDKNKSKDSNNLPDEHIDGTKIDVEKSFGHATINMSKIGCIENNFVDRVSSDITDDSNEIANGKVNESAAELSEQSLKMLDSDEHIETLKSEDGEYSNKKVAAAPVADDSAETTSYAEGEKHKNKTTHYLPKEHIDETNIAKEKSMEYAAKEMSKVHRIKSNFTVMVSADITDDSNEEAEESTAKTSEQSLKMSDSTGIIKHVKSKQEENTNKDVNVSATEEESAGGITYEEKGDKYEYKDSDSVPEEPSHETNTATENETREEIQSTTTDRVYVSIIDDSDEIPIEKVKESATEHSEQNVKKVDSSGKIEAMTVTGEGTNKNVHVSPIEESPEAITTEEGGGRNKNDTSDFVPEEPIHGISTASDKGIELTGKDSKVQEIESTFANVTPVDITDGSKLKDEKEPDKIPNTSLVTGSSESGVKWKSTEDEQKLAEGFKVVLKEQIDENANSFEIKKEDKRSHVIPFEHATTKEILPSEELEKLQPNAKVNNDNVDFDNYQSEEHQQIGINDLPVSLFLKNLILNEEDDMVDKRSDVKVGDNIQEKNIKSDVEEIGIQKQEALDFLPEKQAKVHANSFEDITESPKELMNIENLVLEQQSYDKKANITNTTPRVEEKMVTILDCLSVTDSLCKDVKHEEASGLADEVVIHTAPNDSIERTFTKKSSPESKLDIGVFMDPDTISQEETIGAILEVETTKEAILNDNESVNKSGDVLCVTDSYGKETLHVEGNEEFTNAKEAKPNLEMLEKDLYEEQAPAIIKAIGISGTKSLASNQETLLNVYTPIDKSSCSIVPDDQKLDESLDIKSVTKEVNFGEQNKDRTTEKPNDNMEESPTKESKASELEKIHPSDNLQESLKDTTQMAEIFMDKRSLISEFKNEEATEVKVGEEKTDEEEEENNTKERGLNTHMTVETRDADLKPAHKKNHNILSGVGSKVKHSLAKVKKAITGKSSHPKQLSLK